MGLEMGSEGVYWEEKNEVRDRYWGFMGGE